MGNFYNWGTDINIQGENLVIAKSLGFANFGLLPRSFDMNTYKFAMIIMLGLMVLLHCGCSKKISMSEEISIVIQGDEASKRKLEEIIKANPKVVHPEMGVEYRPKVLELNPNEHVLKANPKVVQPEMGTEYKLQVIEPDTNIDYKIIHITPDENIDYKIIVIDPRTGKEMPKLTKEIGQNISKLLEQKKKQK